MSAIMDHVLWTIFHNATYDDFSILISENNPGSID